MGIHSMTGFGKARSQSDSFSFLVEIKSVNHRFLDTRLRMPAELSHLEISFRKKVAEKLRRGSVDILFQIKPLKGKTDVLDIEKIKQVMEQFKVISQEITFSAGDFLKPEFFQTAELDSETSNKFFEMAENVFDSGLKKLSESRLAEGFKLIQTVGEHLKSFTLLFNKIAPLENKNRDYLETKLKSKFLKSDLKLEENRFHQEIIFYLEKIDISEEINRIKAHISEFERILDSESEVGRRLDFLVQELSRETNTVGAKSGLLEISEIVLEMKLQLEKMREQVANIE